MCDAVIARRDRVGLRPQAALAGATARVAMLQEERAMQRCLDVLPHRHHPDRRALPKHRRLHARRGHLVSPAVLVIPPNVVLQGIGPHDCVAPLGDANDATAGGIVPAGHRLARHSNAPSVYGADGATMTVKAFSTARWTRARCDAPPAHHGFLALQAVLWSQSTHSRGAPRASGVQPRVPTHAAGG